MTVYSLDQLLGRPLNEVENKNAPPRVYTAGPADVPVSGPRVAIIGTRKPTENGINYARDLARMLAGRGAVVVSGLALGIDTVAHRAAMDAGGKTIAVIGTPLNMSYPRQNAELQRLMARDHLVVSQFPIGSPVARRNFPMRNRTMALIADASVIVEAGEKSGTMHQGWEAIRLDRPLYACKPVVDVRPEWLGEMMRHGVTVLDGYEDALDKIFSDMVVDCNA